MARPRGWAAAQPACKHGHPYPQNLAYDKQGLTHCAECARIRWRRWWQEQPPVGPDPIAIERAITGDPPERLTPRERQAAALQLDAWGYSADQIAQRVGCTKRTVHRIRARRRKGYTAAA